MEKTCFGPLGPPGGHFGHVFSEITVFWAFGEVIVFILCVFLSSSRSLCSFYACFYAVLARCAHFMRAFKQFCLFLVFFGEGRKP